MDCSLPIRASERHGHGLRTDHALGSAGNYPRPATSRSTLPNHVGGSIAVGMTLAFDPAMRLVMLPGRTAYGRTTAHR